MSDVYATTSTVVVGDDGTCLVVDPALTQDEVAALADDVAGAGWTPVAVWSTHPHWDHLLDGPGLGRLPRWAAGHPASSWWRREATAERDDDPVLAARPAGAPAVAALSRTVPRRYPGAPGPLSWPGPRVEVLAHDAHAPGSTALLVADAGVLVAGDLLSDREIPLLDLTSPDPVGAYRSALDALLATGATVVVPGHGSVGDDLAARVARDRAYLDALVVGRTPDDERLGDGRNAAEHDRQRATIGM
ncbi:MBL fold metallo-hydrolase [Cellulomonas massiliensis]|uniref:MBL fold metallo-hydrolase n=1 Tax=Cellulomonas massiliensis TaxID=1465811 RepID=UPI0003021BE6|nr:MBL fold metallo-hydrolase [Cellulomonas massiliensis]